MGSIAADPAPPAELVFRSKLPDIEIPCHLTLQDYCFERLPEVSARACLIDGATGAALTYGEVDALSRRCAAGLRRLGVGKGDVVMALLRNCPEFAFVFLGAARLGAATTTANPFYTPHEIHRQATAAGAKVVVTEACAVEKVRAFAAERGITVVSVDGDGADDGCLPFGATLLGENGGEQFVDEEVDPDDVVALPYSSGTTGLPKGVMLTHRSLVTSVAQQVDGENPNLHFSSSDVLLCVLPLFHIYSLNSVLLAGLRAGCAIVIMRKFDHGALVDLVRAHGVTVAPFVPPIVVEIAKSARVTAADLASIRLVMSGAAPMGKELQDAFMAKIPNAVLGQGYGMTEAGPVLAMCLAFAKEPFEVKSGSCGTVVRNAELKIVDPDTGASLGRNRPGEICIRGKQIMKGGRSSLKTTLRYIPIMGSVISGGPLEATTGRFWALSVDDDFSDEDSPATRDDPKVRTQVGSPLLSSYRLPSEEACSMSSSTMTAIIRREQKKVRQREAAAILRSGTSCTSSSPLLPSLGSCSASRPDRKCKITTPVLSPTTFLLDSFNAAEWVQVFRRRQKKSAWRRRRASLPARSVSSPGNRPCQRRFFSNSESLGRMGSGSLKSAPVFDLGRMGQDQTSAIPKTDALRIPQFARGVKYRLGFGAPLKPPVTLFQHRIVSRVSAAMANRGGAPNRGRGAFGGRGGGGWQDGSGGGRGSNYHEGGPSGTAGDGVEADHAGDHLNNVFGDGVFRAGSGRQGFGGGNRQYQGYNNRGDGRRNFGYGGNYNNHRFPSNNSAMPRNGSGNSRYATTTTGLTDAQQRMVTEAAEAFARQLAGRQELPQSGQQYVPKSTSGQTAVQGSALVRHPSITSAPPTPSLVQPTVSTQGQTNAPRAEEVLLAVAGCASKEVLGESEFLTEEDFVAATRKKGPSCFRCRTAGHFLNDCEVILCDCCQRPEHATKDCPLLRAPKPRIAMYGTGHPDLAFWEFPLSKSVRPRVENTRLGRVEVSGGSLSIEQLITHLQWIVPDPQYVWDVQQMEDNVFRVNFPSKNELVRLQHFGRFHVPNSTIILSFDLWKKEIQPAWVPEDVWVRVSGLPPVALDDYLGLWAFGDVFGKTKELDIVFTRQNNVLRILITCLDPSLIPDTWDLKVKNEFFRLTFEVEGEQETNNADVSMSDVHGDGGDDESNPNDQDKPAGGDNDRNVKRTKNVESAKDGKGTSNAPPMATKTALLMNTDSSVVLDTGHLMSPNSENTPSAAAEGAMEYDPVVPRADLISISNKQKNDVLVPEFAVASEETGGTSITMALHAARPSIHAAPRLEPAPHTPSGLKTASGPVVSQPTSHGRFDIMHSEGASNPGFSLAVDTVISCKNLPSMAVEDSEKYAQTVLPDTVIDNKAGKKTSTVADVHGTCRSDFAGAGHVALATPTISKPSPLVGSASPMGKGKSFRPGMHGPSKPIQTTPTKTTSIHTVIKHKGAEKNKIVDFGGIEETTMQSVRSSGRLRAQPNYDATQMERARMILQKRDEIPVIGYPTRCSLDSPMGFTSPYGTTGGYGYWMQPDAGGCSGLLFPGFWMATH